VRRGGLYAELYGTQAAAYRRAVPTPSGSSRRPAGKDSVMETRLRAEFTDADEARDAVLDLERTGVVDADRVEVSGGAPPADEAARRESDGRLGRFAGRAAVGGIIGAVLGAALGAGGTLVLGVEPQPAAALGALLGLGAFGGAAGVFYGMTSKLPVTEGTAEAVDPGAGRTVSLVVSVDDDHTAEKAKASLEGSGARSVRSES
jgi:hypothetical protein